MKAYFLLAAMAISSATFAQTTSGVKSVQVTAASKITVSYGYANDAHKSNGETKYYVNNISYGNLVPIFNPEHIKSVNVEKKDPKILIALKEDYQPNFLAMDQLKKKYVNSKNNEAIYILDGNIVKDQQQMIDENYVLHINVYNSADLPYLQVQGNGIDIIYISLKSKTNLEKANTIYIRGNNSLGK